MQLVQDQQKARLETPGMEMQEQGVWLLGQEQILGYSVPGRPPQPKGGHSTLQKVLAIHNTDLEPETDQPLVHQTTSTAPSTSPIQENDVGSCHVLATVQQASASPSLTLDDTQGREGLPLPESQQVPHLEQSACDSLVQAPIVHAPASHSHKVATQLVDMLLFPESSDGSILPAAPQPAKPLVKPSTLKETCFILPSNQVFVDKILPPIAAALNECGDFPLQYFLGLHTLVSAPTISYGAFTPNYLGARIPLQHTRLNIQRWRSHLIGYEGAEIVQFLQYGFPIGLSQNPPPTLVSTLRNHGSSYQYYKHMDEFLSTGLDRCELAGPCLGPPFTEVHISPLMTAVKKPDGRRAVFDATFGEQSLNNNTPTDAYLDQPFTYDFPKMF